MGLESVTEPEILEILRPIIKRYALERNEGEHFGDLVIRAGYIAPTMSGLTWYESTACVQFMSAGDWLIRSRPLPRLHPRETVLHPLLKPPTSELTPLSIALQKGDRPSSGAVGSDSKR